MAVSSDVPAVPNGKRPWQYYRGPRGEDPVRAYLAGLPRGDALLVRARLKQLRDQASDGRAVAPGIFEVRARRGGTIHAVLFARDGQGRVALEAYSPVGKRTPRPCVATAQDRLTRWRARGATRGPFLNRDLGLGR